MSKFCCIILHRFSSLTGTNSLRRSAFSRNRTQQAQSLLYVLNQLATHPAKGNKYNASKMGEEKKKITFACPVSSLKEPRIHNLLPTRSGGSTTHTRVLTGKLSTSEKDESVSVIHNKELDHEILMRRLKRHVLFNELDAWSKLSAAFIFAELARPCNLVKLCLNNIELLSKHTAKIGRRLSIRKTGKTAKQSSSCWLAVPNSIDNLRITHTQNLC